LNGNRLWLPEAGIDSGGSAARQPRYSNGHKFVVASNGVRHVVWSYSDHVVYQRYYPSTGAWTPETTIFNTSPATQYPSIALDADGTTIHVGTGVLNYNVGGQYYHIFYKKCAPTTSGNGGWDTTVDVCSQNHESQRVVQGPSIACGPNHQVVISWDEYTNATRGVGFREVLNGTWQNATLLDGNSTYYRYCSSICTYQNGDVFVGYTTQHPGQGYLRIWTVRRIGGIWQAPEDATTSGLQWGDSCCVAVDPTTQYPHVVFHGATSSGATHIYHNWRAGSGWQSTPDIASTPTGTRPCYLPSCEFKPSGELQCAWYAWPESKTKYHVAFNEWSSGSWGTPIWLTDTNGIYDDQYPSITTDAYGRTYVVYARSANYSLYGRMEGLHDVGTDSITRPLASYLVPGWKIPPAARIKNYGPNPEGPFDVKFTVVGNSYSSTKSVSSLAAGATTTVVFDSLTLDTIGSFTAKCSTMLAGDELMSDNKGTAPYQGCTFINFFDLDSGKLTPAPASGKWDYGKPVSPWAFPPMDTAVWGNRLNGNYDPSEKCTLTSPTYVTLKATPVVAFQHNFDTQADRDGGNFSYWTNIDGWQLLTPSGGKAYSGSVFALGQSGWSGGPSGWNQSVFEIPLAANKQFKVRWRFAADADDVVSHGWLIDEVAGVRCNLAPPPPEGGLQPGDSVISELDISPNPVRGPGQVSYTLLKDCPVSIKLYDVTGALAARLATNGFNEGVHTAAMDASKLHHGVYFLTIAGQGDIKTTKVIIE
jgi:hypothetical protein